MVDFIPDHGASAAEALDGMRVLVRRARRAGRDQLGPLGMTPARLAALRTLDRLASADPTDDPPHGTGDGASGRTVRMGQLARELDVVPRSATDLIDDLEELGLVVRRRDPADRRATAVEVTAAGRQLLADFAERRREVARELLADLDEDELRLLARLIGRAVG